MKLSGKVAVITGAAQAWEELWRFYSLRKGLQCCSGKRKRDLMS